MIVTWHAAMRFRQRRGISTRRTVEWLTQELLALIKDRRYLYGNYWYSHGLVFVICEDTVVTVFKPHNRRIQAAIRHVFQKSRAKAKVEVSRDGHRVRNGYRPLHLQSR